MPPVRLPLASLSTPVHRLAARVTAAKLLRNPMAILLLPEEPTAADWAALPFGESIRTVFAQKSRKAAESFQLRLGRGGETELLVTVLAPRASPFERLQAAAKLTRTALAGEPESLLLFSQGLAAEAANGALLALVAAIQAAAFPFANFKAKPKPRKRLGSIELASTLKGAAIDVAVATSAGNNLARWLTALPPNVLDAAGYRRLLQEFARKLGLRYKFYGERELARLGAGAFLAVARANPTRDAGIVHLAYRPRGAKLAPLGLVGKGICFDTGGTNLKPHKSMLDMHTDMEGSAVAVGSLHALHALGAAVPVDCWLAITENLIGPTAYKPQDIVRTMNGTTIQVIHTDAEGRMVLADTLSLAATKKPRAIIDFATLTGACVYALTERYSGAFTNRLETRDLIESAGAACGERVWCFPMDEDFDSDLDSTVADVLQCAVDGKGDHILAARFLNRFVPQAIPWLHIDLSAGSRTGGLGAIATDITGFGVRYTVELVTRGWPDLHAARAA
jgi:leucyl aminopeptidase